MVPKQAGRQAATQVEKAREGKSVQAGGEGKRSERRTDGEDKQAGGQSKSAMFLGKL